MRISDLSRRSGVPVDTIKYYLRERLLPATTKNVAGRTEFGEEHLARLRLARALIAVARLPVAVVRQVLEASGQAASADDLRRRLVGFLPSLPSATADVGDIDAARSRVDEFVAQLGWQPAVSEASRIALARALAALWHVAWPGDIDALMPYADVAEWLAVHDSLLPPITPQDLVGRTILLEVALAAIRRMACEQQLFVAGEAPMAADVMALRGGA